MAISRGRRILSKLEDRVEAEYNEATQALTDIDAPANLSELTQESVARASDPEDDFNASDAVGVIESAMRVHLKSINARTRRDRQRHSKSFDTAREIVGSGGDFMPLDEAIERHLKEREPHINASTLDRKGNVLGAFKTWHGDSPVSEVTHLKAGKYLDDQLKGAPGAKWNLQALSAAWRFFKRRRWVESNIWEDFGVELKGSTRGKADNGRRRPWTDEEITKLVEAIRDNRPRLDKLDLRALLLIGLYTGARREEVAGAHIDNVDTKHWAI
ncbi:MAG: hypothetical protein IIA10_11400, partial [Proteobacteria bacterium]|nr:hypothetical protein [Pseudomonadota bacterium]